ncbi:MAG: PilZ domain-containing protein [Bdellovibrionales bacterium CG10_big_fil_rev_8_21_14_0_10_45_34]|nr:MAG: PilZ domain-containing protein [Bdellovibrionales bacterium CG10_big_fil_rev_8_21_14_0_10_45_34]
MNISEIPSPAPRTRLEYEVEYRRSYARESHFGVIKNISLTGAFISDLDKGDLAPRDKVSIVLKVSGRKRKINAEVVWTANDGVGIRFNHFNNRDVQLVDDLMYFVESSRSKQRGVLEDIFKIVS